MGVDPAEFYAYLGNYAADIDVVKWDMGNGFAAALLERVIEPGMHGEDLIKTWPYLTRMYTTISPNEMMEDPIFHVNASLPDVPALRTAQNYVLCNGDSVVTLPGGDEFYIPGAGRGRRSRGGVVGDGGADGGDQGGADDDREQHGGDLEEARGVEPEPRSGDVPTTGDVSGTGTTSSGGWPRPSPTA
jgi:hypothetical protein